jgi:hypothetical protein
VSAGWQLRHRELAGSAPADRGVEQRRADSARCGEDSSSREQAQHWVGATDPWHGMEQLFTQRQIATCRLFRIKRDWCCAYGTGTAGAAADKQSSQGLAVVSSWRLLSVHRWLQRMGCLKYGSLYLFGGHRYTAVRLVYNYAKDKECCSGALL